MAVTHTVADNITLARGRLYFAPFIAGTTTPQDAELYLGNTPGCSLTGEVEKLDHYTADTKVRSKDRSIVIEANYSGTLDTDNVSTENLARFFMGTASTVTTTAATGKPIAQVAERLGIMRRAEMQKLLVAERLTQAGAIQAGS